MPTLPRPLVAATATVAVVAALVLLATPADAAKTLQVPPDETGLGRNDVRDEPNTLQDRAPPTNGFPSCGTLDSGGTTCDDGPHLVLESLYQSSTLESNHDVNNLLRAVVASAGAPVEAPDRIYPGDGSFQAYWGWWQDRVSRSWIGAKTVGGAPDGRIDDAHDARNQWDDDPRMGAWDEFAWRGSNPWADDHPLASIPNVDPPVAAYDDDLQMFVQPGTHHPREGNGLGLVTGADEARVADARFEDDTGVSPYSPPGVRQKQTWDGAQGYDFTFTDQSLLMATEVTAAANPTPLGRDRYDVDGALRADVDRYAAVAPALETLYRTAVWDPGDEVDGPADAAVGDRGVKGFLRGNDPATEGETLARDLALQATYPLAPATGAADDAAGKAPARHEPNDPRDAYPGASHDPATAYNGLSQGPYYEPGSGQTYDRYRERDRPWLDAQAGYGGPAYLVLLPFPFNFNAHPAPNLDSPVAQDGEPTHAPGFLYVTAQFGLWWDENDDSWVGRLDDPGRPTRPGDPYRSGEVDDPNDYADTPTNAEAESSRQGVGEFRPICKEGASLEGTLRPGTPDGSWGPTGVYVVQDEQEPGYNPWDDAAADVTGDTPQWEDEDDERFSRHVAEGPIDFSFKFCSKDRGWSGNKMVFFPAGTAGYTVTMEVTATLETRSTADGPEPFTARPDSARIPAGTTVTDVDVVHDWGVDG
jgi:hypothetical protein